jgi:hypothetical protein
VPVVTATVCQMGLPPGYPYRRSQATKFPNEATGPVFTDLFGHSIVSRFYLRVSTGILIIAEKR